MSSLFKLLAIAGFVCLVWPNNVAPFMVKLNEDDFTVDWTYDQPTKRFSFTVKAKTTGWVGFALTKEDGGKEMKNYDIVIGGVRNGNETYLNDYWSTSETTPTLDTKQDLTLASASETGGVTILKFSRLANTLDSTQDVEIKADTKIFMAWAVGPSDATNSTTFAKHADKEGGGRGHTKVAYNMFTGEVIPTTKPPTQAAHVNQASVGLVFIALLQVAVIVMLR